MHAHEDTEKEKWKLHKDTTEAKEIAKDLDECLEELGEICAYLKGQELGFNEFNDMKKAFSSFRRGYREVEVLSVTQTVLAMSIQSKLQEAKSAVQKAKEIPKVSRDMIFKLLEMKKTPKEHPSLFQDLFDKLKQFFNPEKTNKFDLFIKKLEALEKKLESKNDARFFLPKPPLPKEPRPKQKNIVSTNSKKIV